MLGRLLKRLLPRRFGIRVAGFRDVYAFYERGELDRAQRLVRGINDASTADIRFLEGLIARKRGDAEQAVACMTVAVSERPDELSFRIALGELLLELGRYEAAGGHFEACLERVGDEAPVYASVAGNAGKCWLELGKLERARVLFEKALAAKPADALLRGLLAATLYRESSFDEARATLAPLAAEGNAGVRLRRALFLPPVYDSRDHIEETRERFERELDEIIDSPGDAVVDPVTEIGATAFYLAYHDRNNAQLMRKLCRAVRAAYPASNVQRSPSTTAGGGRIRVGFVSNFFHMHSVGRVTIGLMRDLPRGEFEVHVFAIAPNEDALRSAIERAADRYYALPAILDDAKRAIEDAALDVLIYADIGMHPLTYFLALTRLAPLQAVWWGHPETTGIDTIDCFFSADAVETPDADAHYTERLVRPRAFFLPGYEKAALERPLSREALGLPEGKHVYACLQPAFKIHPDMDALFAAILERDPDADIVLRDTVNAGSGRLRRRLERTLGAHAARVRFLPSMPVQQYLATLAVSDVALDPLYFGGGNSSCDALAMGLPLVSMPGEHLYGRLTLGIYREMEVEECLVSSIPEFADVACRIALDSEYRQSLSRTLVERSEVVYDRRDITDAYAGVLREAVLRVT